MTVDIYNLKQYSDFTPVKNTDGTVTVSVPAFDPITGAPITNSINVTLAQLNGIKTSLLAQVDSVDSLITKING